MLENSISALMLFSKVEQVEINTNTNGALILLKTSNETKLCVENQGRRKNVKYTPNALYSRLIQNLIV